MTVKIESKGKVVLCIVSLAFIVMALACYVGPFVWMLWASSRLAL